MIKTHLERAVLDPFQIDTIAGSWGDYKHTTVFKIIATYPDILTHYIMQKAPCNNVPDMVVLINKKLIHYGLACVCTPQTGKSAIGNSHHWYLISLNDQPVKNDY